MIQFYHMPCDLARRDGNAAAHPCRFLPGSVSLFPSALDLIPNATVAQVGTQQ